MNSYAHPPEPTECQLPEPDNDTAVKFLQRYAPDGSWVLTAIHPEKKSIETATFGPNKIDAMRAWLEKHNGKRNLYFSVNPTLEDMSKKASREDIASLSCLHVDIDPRTGEDIQEEQKRCLGQLTDELPEDVPEPTCIIFSGGGYQGFWRLKDPVPIDGDLEMAEDAKLYNLQMERLFDADNCHNVDRIMRLPGTINLPDAKKLNKGRKPALAEVVSFSNKTYPISAFKKASKEQALVPRRSLKTVLSQSAVDEFVTTKDLDTLDKWNVPDRVKVIIAQGRHPDQPKDKDNSRSAWLFDVCCSLVRCGVPDGVILGILLDSGWGISESVLERGTKARGYAEGQVEKARAEVVKSNFCELQLDGKGKPSASPHNIRVAINRLGVHLSHDQFADRLLIDGLPGFGPALQDDAVARLWLTIDEKFGFRTGKDLFWTVVEDYARQNGFHPVCDYLDGLNWDGTSRVDGWLASYGNAEDDEYTRAVGALFLLAAVRRVRRPGCKFDEMLVLRSAQGTGKSSALEALCPRSDWFGDDLPLNADTKVVIERLHGRWIVEAAELKGMRKGEVEHLKAFLSRQIDRARMAYARVPKEVPRQCVIAGTTNSEQFLRDTTDNRRFWPVEVGQFDAEALRADRDQLWAEAAKREAAGESIRLDPSLYPIAAEAQERHRVEDPFEGSLADVLGEMQGKVRAADIWAIIGVPSGQRNQEHNARLGEAMRRLGWERKKRRFGATNPEWCYVRGDSNERILIEATDEGGIEARPESYEHPF